MAKDRPDLFQREWLPVPELEASLLFYGHNAKVRFTPTGMIVELWFPWTKLPHKKESSDDKAEGKT